MHRDDGTALITAVIAVRANYRRRVISSRITPGMATAMGLILSLYALAFWLFAALHAGARIQLGLAVLDEPERVYAVIVEGVSGVALGLGALAVLTRRTWAWPAALGSQLISLAGVLLGMTAIAAGRGVHTRLNDTFHGAMVTLLVAGLVLLVTPTARAALGRR